MTGTPPHAPRGGGAGVIRVFADLTAAAEALAARVADEATRSISARGGFRLALSGGETPVPLYHALASERWRGRVDWARCVLLLADERAVPDGAPERTDRLVRETLLEPLGLDASRLRPMLGGAADLDAAARLYELELAVPIDLLLLGLGADGHIASLFPGAEAVGERGRRVVAVLDSPKPPPQRLTLAPRAIAEARSVCVLVAGASKATAVAAALGGRAAPVDCPGALVSERDWYLDRAANAGRAS